MTRNWFLLAAVTAVSTLASVAGDLTPLPRSEAQALVSSEQAQFTVVELARGLEHPWGMTFLPDTRILITERPGRLRLFTPAGLQSQPIAGVPEVAAIGQGGLLDIALHPEFEATGWIYLAYAAAGPGGFGTQVARARWQQDQLTDLQVVFDMEPKTGGGRHFGSRLAFSPSGDLYISLGDRGERNRAQDLGDPAGSMLRLQADGSVPADNPFVDQSGALPEIFSWGHRNIQGMAVHPETGAIWTHEHGPRGGDEINILEAGVNYGWPLISYGQEYSGGPVGRGLTAAEGLAQPILQWTPSIAPSGMAFYTGEAFPDWQGDLFVGALAGQYLERLELEGEQVVAQERLLAGQVGRIRDVRMGPDGLIYLLTDAPNGRLLRIEPAS